MLLPFVDDAPRGWDMGTIRGLSLTRPWPFVFNDGGREEPKRVENRVWSPPGSVRGRYVALHAAKSWSEEDREWIEDVTGLRLPGRKDTPHSEIFAVCRVTGCAETVNDGDLRPGQRVWFFGPYGWLIDDYVRLVEPVPCAGALGLWKFDERPAELRALRESYRRSVKVAA